MVRRIDLMAIKFYEKEVLTGSLDGMRYRIRYVQGGDDAEDSFEVVLYPDVWCFEKTDESVKQYYHFPFTEDGLKQITAFLNAQAEEQKDLWKA
ncbi:MAG: hypothetical protein J5795_02735 [Lachnospiraceae bacterium]|nr:hypothetical protein [Lachnospiraceae bacterium]MBO7631427.1 hypothetical protein [Lachnospiraceae bacterium]